MMLMRAKNSTKDKIHMSTFWRVYLALSLCWIGFWSAIYVMEGNPWKVAHLMAGYSFGTLLVIGARRLGKFLADRELDQK